MENTGRYTVPTNEDTEPGSDGEVLKNYLKIISKEEIEAVEEEELNRAELELINIYSLEHKFTLENLCDIHELWLGDIYPSAGKYRTVSMSKNGFLFAPSSQIPRLMKYFESNILAKYTPCHYSNNEELSFILGKVHVEFILIHPFREGNGRVARLLADLMTMQAGRPPLNFLYIDQTKNPEGYKEYILAIQAGIDVNENYEAMKRIFKIIIDDSI